MDAAIRAGGRGTARMCGAVGTEWILLDTRGCDPGAYVIREWTDASGVARSVERPPTRRRGGAVGLFTLQPGCVSAGPCPVGVDEGAGLLLMGFGSMLAVPLPAYASTLFSANWLLVLSEHAQTFSDTEIDRIVLLVLAILCDEPVGAMPRDVTTQSFEPWFEQAT